MPHNRIVCSSPRLRDAVLWHDMETPHPRAFAILHHLVAMARRTRNALRFFFVGLISTPPRVNVAPCDPRLDCLIHQTFR
jgi:hypothetical protein